MLNEEQVKALMNKNTKLANQTYDQISGLTVDSFHVKSRQATINIGTIGHVAHGKSTVVRAISGVNVGL